MGPFSQQIWITHICEKKDFAKIIWNITSRRRIVVLYWLHYIELCPHLCPSPNSCEYSWLHILNIMCINLLSNAQISVSNLTAILWKLINYVSLNICTTFCILFPFLSLCSVLNFIASGDVKLMSSWAYCGISMRLTILR